ncbi:MAG: helix-turn-helix transcriptional regulator [Ruminococcaceae bacterium]|nr:helix-turn-helix transcriptional regulator [Oscillospiraceae bacterium]
MLRLEREPYAITITPLIAHIFMPPIVWKGDCVGHIGINDTFFFVAEGECFLHIESQASIIRPGQLAYLPKGKMRSYTHISPRFEMYEVGFKAEADGMSLMEMLGLTERDFVVDVPNPERIKEMFSASNRVEMYVDSLQEVEWSANILEIIRIYTQEHRKTSESAKSHFSAALEYISDNLDKTMATEELASTVHMQTTYFIRRFKEVFGMPPQTYVGLMRTYKAMSLLASTDKSIEAVSLAVGIEDTSYFSRFFKKHCGVTPTEYRKAFKKNT